MVGFVINYVYNVTRAILDQSVGLSLRLGRFLKRFPYLCLFILILAAFQKTHFASESHHDLDCLVVYFVKNALLKLHPKVLHVYILTFLKIVDLLARIAVDNNQSTHEQRVSFLLSLSWLGQYFE